MIDKTIHILPLIQKLYHAHPNGYLCFDFYAREHYKESYPLFYDDIYKKIDLIKDNKCLDKSKIICICLNQQNLNTIVHLLDKFEKDQPLFYGSIMYYSSECELLYEALNFIDQEMPAEDVFQDIAL